MEELSMSQQILILFKLFYLKCCMKRFFFKKKLKYKSIYMYGYVWPNIVIKALRKIYKMLLYVAANVAIKPNWQSLKFCKCKWK